jgi:basic amino acid/polyamine antiporter, APA family
LERNQTAGLIRAIGRWSLAALTINSVIGSGIFRLPADVAGLTGPASPIAVLIAGAATGIVMACFAELASYFREAGGPYLYGREAFGRLIGLEIGWLLWLAQLSACAANTDLFVIYLAQFWRHAGHPVSRSVVLTVLVGLLALVNYCGVRGGTRLSNIFTLAKLLPLILLIVAGIVYVAIHQQAAVVKPVQAGSDSWLTAILLMFFAYGGFETALVPMSEAKNPERDAVFALFVSLAVITVMYTLIQWIVVDILPDPLLSRRPLAEVASITLGSGGAMLVGLGALVSCYGYLSAKALSVPRITLALAEEGDFPKIFGIIHPRFHTPYFSIVVFAVLTWLLALLGNFSWNVTLSAVARLFYYAAGCAALPMLRKKRPGQARFHLPGGVAIAFIGIAVCMILVSRVDMSKSLVLLAAVMAALLNWLWVRCRTKSRVNAENQGLVRPTSSM